MAEYRVPTTTKVQGLIATHADVLETHGISGGLHASRPTAGTAGKYYFSTDQGVWARDNGTSWDECEGLSEAYIQSLIDASITTHTGNASAHHTKYTDAEAQSVADTQIATHTGNANAHHTAPTYDSPNEEIVFQI